MDDLGLDIGKSMERLQVKFEKIRGTMKDTQLTSWYSGQLVVASGATQMPSYTAHPSYPSISVLIRGISDSDGDLGLGFVSNGGEPTHIGTTLIGCLTDDDLAPSTSDEVDRRIKPWDKLVAPDGSVYYVTETVASPGGTHCIMALRREDPRPTTDPQT